MAALPDADRRHATRRFIERIFVEGRQTATFSTDQLKAAVDAIDDWIEANAQSFNQSLPPQFRNNASAEQKTQLFCFVALKRAGLT